MGVSRVSGRSAEHRRIRGPFAVAFLLSVALVAGCGGGSTSSGDGSAIPTSAPISSVGVGDASSAELAAATPMTAPTVIDVPSTEVASQMVTSEGATIVVDEMTLMVPPGAVEKDTAIEVVRLDAPFQMNPYADDPSGAVAVAAAGPLVDFGPVGTSFDQPVSVTLPYDPGVMNADLDQPVVAYWTGEAWSLLAGDVDAANHTVTIRLASFDGVLLTSTVTGADAMVELVEGAGRAGATALRWIAGTDPIYEREADQFVTPMDPTVQAAAAVANADGVLLANEAELAELLERGTSVKVAIPDADGAPRNFAYTQRSGANWQKPADHLSATPTGDNYDGVPAIGKMQGDCTDVTNTMASIFRSLGYPAKAVFGYTVDTNSPHAWVEVVIGGKPYIVDENGAIQDLKKGFGAMQLIRPDPATDERAREWDETGMRPYEADWWTKYATPEFEGEWIGTMTWQAYTTTTAGECTSGEGLPLTVDLTMTVAAGSAGGYDVRFQHGTPAFSFTATASSAGSSCEDARWSLSEQPADYSLAMQLNGQSVSGQTGTGYTLALIGTFSGTSNLSGDITVTYNTGVLAGTWTATKS